jgi:hypothetical protein
MWVVDQVKDWLSKFEIGFVQDNNSLDSYSCSVCVFWGVRIFMYMYVFVCIYIYFYVYMMRPVQCICVFICPYSIVYVCFLYVFVCIVCICMYFMHHNRKVDIHIFCLVLYILGAQWYMWSHMTVEWGVLVPET